MKTTLKIIWLNNIIFLVVFLFLSFINKPAADDYWFLSHVRDLGVFDLVKQLYNNASGRWSANFAANVFYALYLSHPVTIAIPALFNLIFGIAISFLFIKKYYIINNIVHKPFQIAGISIFFILSLFLCTFDIGESWFWTVSITVYFFSIWCFLGMLYLIFWCKNNCFNFILLIAMSVYIGGASEGYAIFFIFVLTVVFFFSFFGKYFSTFTISQKLKNRYIIKLLLAIVFITIGLYVNYISNGTASRQSWLPKPTLFTGFWMTAYTFIQIILPNIVKIFPILLALLLISFSFFSIHQHEKFPTINNLKKSVLFLFFICLILVLVMLFPTAFLLSDALPNRALSIVSLFIVVLAIYLGYFLSRLKVKKVKAHSFAQIAIAVFTIYWFVMLAIKIPQTWHYAKAWAVRNESLKQQISIKTTDTIVVKYLPSPGFLYSVEDTLHLQNMQWQQMELYYNFNGKIIYQK